MAFKILIIDDDATTRILLNGILKKQGYEVYTAENGTIGLDLATTLRPALIICDWVMDDVDGLEVCRRIKVNSDLSITFFILLTLRQTTEDCIEGLNAGADEFLAKPIDGNELKARVRAGLRLYQTSLDLQRRNQTLEQLSQDLQVKTDIITSELAEAAAYIQALLPLPLSGDISTEICFIPSRQLGGDCFDYYWLNEDQLVIYLLDVSGHGLAAALPSISIFNLLHMRSLSNIRFDHPAEVLAGLNQLALFNQEQNKYVTLWYGVYDRRSRQLTYASAGHPPAILVSPTQLQCLRTPGLPIGLFSDAEFEVQQCHVEAHSKLYVFSDGVYEGALPGQAMLGLEGWIAILQTTQHQPKSINQLVSLIQDQQQTPSFADDFSLLSVSF
jgi:phosphoserine phosphatase RsbU/P